MDFTLTDQQQMYVDTVGKFVRTEILPSVLKMEKAHTFPWDVVRKAWDLGILTSVSPNGSRATRSIFSRPP